MAAVVVVDMAQTVQFEWTHSGPETHYASPLSGGTRLLIDLDLLMRPPRPSHVFKMTAGLGVGNEVALFDFGGFRANIRVSKVLW